MRGSTNWKSPESCGQHELIIRDGYQALGLICLNSTIKFNQLNERESEYYLLISIKPCLFVSISKTNIRGHDTSLASIEMCLKLQLTVTPVALGVVSLPCLPTPSGSLVVSMTLTQAPRLFTSSSKTTRLSVLDGEYPSATAFEVRMKDLIKPTL